MALNFNQTRAQRLGTRIAELRSALLDAVYAPVISRLTDEQYFTCQTRNDCLRTYLRGRLA